MIVNLNNLAILVLMLMMKFILKLLKIIVLKQFEICKCFVNKENIVEDNVRNNEIKLIKISTKIVEIK